MGGNAVGYIDRDGLAIETPWDALNVALGVASTAVNIARGNYVDAAVDALGVVADLAAAATPGVPGGAATAIKAARCAAKETFNFTKTAATHMNEVERMIPIQIIDDIIKSPIQISKDPRGTNALMYYSKMSKNNKTYNVEVLYDKSTNTIMHFKYTQKSIGSLNSIPK